MSEAKTITEVLNEMWTVINDVFQVRSGMYEDEARIDTPTLIRWAEAIEAYEKREQEPAAEKPEPAFYIFQYPNGALRARSSEKLVEPEDKEADITPLYTSPMTPVVFGLNNQTALLVEKFSDALAKKLKDAQDKYGYGDNWRREGWADECREHLLEHLAKGDPRDVAAYCAFLWYHGESTAAPQPQVPEECESDVIERQRDRLFEAMKRIVAEGTSRKKAARIALQAIAAAQEVGADE